METKLTFAQLINESETPILVDFTAAWCGPCQTMAPILKDLASDMENEVRIIKIDIDKNPAAAQKYEVRSVPTFMLFHKGNILWRQSGAMPGRQMADAIRGVI